MHNEILSGCQRFLPQLFGQRHPENFAAREETELEFYLLTKKL